MAEERIDLMFRCPNCNHNVTNVSVQSQEARNQQELGQALEIIAALIIEAGGEVVVRDATLARIRDTTFGSTVVASWEDPGGRGRRYAATEPEPKGDENDGP